MSATAWAIEASLDLLHRESYQACDVGIPDQKTLFRRLLPDLFESFGCADEELKLGLY